MGEDTDPDESQDVETYADHKRAKNPRAADPDDAGERDPARDRDDPTGFEGLLSDVETEKSAQETLEDAIADWDPTGRFAADDDGEKVRTTLTAEEVAEADLSPDERREALLTDIRDRLDDMAEADRDRTAKDATLREADPFERALSEIEALAEDDDETDGDDSNDSETAAAAFESLLTAYVEDGGDPSDLLRWVADSAKHIKDAETRRRALSALESVGSVS